MATNSGMMDAVSPTITQSGGPPLLLSRPGLFSTGGRLVTL